MDAFGQQRSAEATRARALQHVCRPHGCGRNGKVLWATTDGADAVGIDAHLADAHTHARARTHAHARTRTHTRTCAQAQAQVRASTRARAHENTCSHACACTDKTQWMTPCAQSKRLTRTVETQAALGDHLSDARAAIAHRGRSIDRRPAWSAGRRRSACDAVGKQRASAHRPKDCCTQRTHGLEPAGLLPRWQC